MTHAPSDVLRVLLVEDNPGDALLIAEALDELPRTPAVTRVDRLAAAEQRLTGQRFDVVLLDLGLPDSRGIDTLKRLLASTGGGCAVIVLTGLADEHLAQASIAAGAQDYLVKGRVDGEQLGRAVRYAVERKRAENQLRRAKALSDALNRIDALIFSTLDIDAIAAQVLAEASAALALDLAVIFLPQAEGRWVARYVHGIPELTGRHFSGKDIGYSVKAVRERRVVVINGLDRDGDLRRPWSAHYGLCGLIDAPLELRDGVHGDLALYTRSPQRVFSEQEADFVGKVAAAVSLAIQNASLFTELSRANQDLDAFASVVSHDLKAPLRALAALAGLVHDDAAGRLDPEDLERLRTIQERAARMGQLVDGLLAYARLGAAAGQPETLVLERMLDTLVGELALPAGFTVHLERPLPEVHADPVQLRQVFQNLIANAVHHHDRARGNIWIRARGEDGCWVLEVADDGPGIPPAERERVFRMFSTGNRRDHTGIGLALVRKLALDNGGRVEVADNAPRGALLRVYWPM